MRKINKIILHCSATKEGQEVTIETIRKWHKARGFADVGYHYVIYPDGKRVTGRPVSKAGAHVTGQNSNSIGVCYIGGLDAIGKPKDTRTYEQKKELETLLQELIKEYGSIKEIAGHRDYSPDKNSNGIIEKHEWLKACPCFDAKDEYKHLL